MPCVFFKLRGCTPSCCRRMQAPAERMAGNMTVFTGTVFLPTVRKAFKARRFPKAAKQDDSPHQLTVLAILFFGQLANEQKRLAIPCSNSTLRKPNNVCPCNDVTSYWLCAQYQYISDCATSVQLYLQTNTCIPCFLLSEISCTFAIQCSYITCV